MNPTIFPPATVKIVLFSLDRATGLEEGKPVKMMIGSARGVMVIVVGNGHIDTSSYPGRD